MRPKPNFRKPNAISKWQQVREWLNVIATAGTILIGLGTLWVTARVSGLEDYFQSEISSRNSQLSSVLAESSSASRQLRANEQQLMALRSVTDGTVATALATQAQLAGSTASLLAVQGEVAREKSDLQAARSLANNLSALTERQEDVLALLFAREVHDRAIFSIGTVVLNDGVKYDEARPEIRFPFGKQAYESFKRLAALKADDPQVGPAYRQLVTRIPEVCPGFVDREVVAPAVPTMPDAAPYDYPRGASRSTIASLVQSRRDSDASQIIARSNVVQEGIRSYTDETVAFMTYSYGCVCEAMAPDPADKLTVCGASSTTPR